MDSLVEQLTRTVAQRTSRRGFLARMGKLMLGGMVLPLLPIDRVMGTAQAQMTMGPSGTGRTDDPSTVTTGVTAASTATCAAAAGAAIPSAPPAL